jgi:peptidoglycan-N-acetylglucosamine deacetylase
MIANPPPWPNGARCAAAITFDMDSDSMLHYSLPAAHTRAAALSWAQYDRIAVPRILQLFERYGIRQTFFVPGWCMERYPELVEAILAGGHEIGLHGYLHEVAYEQPSRERERELLERGLEAMDRIAGQRPRGWRAPLYGFSQYTAVLLAEAGFDYDSSLMGDDVPYLLDTPAGQLVELPTEWANDDWPQYVQSFEFQYYMPIRSPNAAYEVFRAEFDAAYEFGGLWIAPWHPFVSGRPARSMGVGRLIEYMLEKGDVWLSALEDIAQHIRRCIEDGTYRPRLESMPAYAEAVVASGPNLTEGASSGDRADSRS